MNIYISTKWENRQAAAELSRKLEALGHTITERWWEHESWSWDNFEEAQKRAPHRAIANVLGVVAADCFILLTPKDEWQREHMIGVYVELGVALGVVPYIYVVGDQPKNTFRYHPEVNVLPDIQELLHEPKIYYAY